MFIGPPTRSGYDPRSGEQIAAGLFLILFQPRWPAGLRPPLRAAVRMVHLRQVGHFMMGRVQIGKVRVTLSGAYGADGLPCDMPIGVEWTRLVPLPPDVAEAFWTGGGHNSAGAEAPILRRWAQANLDALRRAGSARSDLYPESQEKPNGKDEGGSGEGGTTPAAGE